MSLLAIQQCVGLGATLSPSNQFCAVRALPRSIFLQSMGFLGLGVRKYLKNGLFTSLCLIHETSLFKISFKSCLGSFFWFGGSWRNIVRSFSFCCPSMLNWVRKSKIANVSNFPRANSEISYEGSTHIKPVTPIQLPCSQLPMTIYNHF